MRIACAKIGNFRCFRESESGDVRTIFKPTPGLNLLVGPNGSGKSALIDAIDLVLNSDGHSNRSLVTEYDFPFCDINRAIFIEVILTDLGATISHFESDIQWVDKHTTELIDEQEEEPDESDHERALVVAFRASRDQEDGEVKWRWLLPKFGETEIDEAKELTRKQHEALGYFRIQPHVARGAFSLGEYSALGRHLRKLNFRMGRLLSKVLPMKGTSVCRMDGSACKNCNLKTVCGDPERGDRTLAAALGSIVTQAKDILGPQVWRGLQAELGPRFGEIRSQLAGVTLGFGKEDAAEVQFIPFENLSAGEKYALSFSLATAQIPGDRPPIVVMEEPETALYPSGIGKMISEAHGRQSGEVPQVIVTSHSESVLRRFALNEVFVMDAGNQPKKLVALLESASPPVSERMTRDLETLIMPGGASVLFADKVMILEGADDAIVSGYLDRLASRVSARSGEMCSSFASQGWVTFGASGASTIPERTRLYSTLQKRVAVLFDGDKEGQEYAEETSKTCPTFIYGACQCEDEPRIEDALLLGLPEKSQENVLEEFYSHPACKNCASATRDKKCWHEKCPRSNGRPRHKADFQRICLLSYEELNTLPPVFERLLLQLEKAKIGKVVEVAVEE